MDLVSSWYAPILQIVEIYQLIEAKPHHHIKVDDHSGDLNYGMTKTNTDLLLT